jgi:hypothetical protein
MNDDYGEKLLYSQSCTSEEGQMITSSIYAVKWTYPGAITSTSGRVRITCIYEDNGTIFNSISGIIERWSDKGWLMLDEYCDDNLQFCSEESFRKRLLMMAHSFIMGVFIDKTSNEYDYTPKPPSTDPKPKKFNHDLRVIKFNKERSKSKKDSLKSNESNKKDSDFDWI